MDRDAIEVREALEVRDWHRVIPLVRSWLVLSSWQRIYHAGFGYSGVARVPWEGASYFLPLKRPWPMREWPTAWERKRLAKSLEKVMRQLYAEPGVNPWPLYAEFGLLQARLAYAGRDVPITRGSRGAPWKWTPLIVGASIDEAVWRLLSGTGPTWRTGPDTPPPLSPASWLIRGLQGKRSPYMRGLIEQIARQRFGGHDPERLFGERPRLIRAGPDALKACPTGKEIERAQGVEDDPTVRAVASEELGYFSELGAEDGPAPVLHDFEAWFHGITKSQRYRLRQLVKVALQSYRPVWIAGRAMVVDPQPGPFPTGMITPSLAAAVGCNEHALPQWLSDRGLRIARTGPSSRLLKPVAARREKWALTAWPWKACPDWIVLPSAWKDLPHHALYRRRPPSGPFQRPHSLPSFSPYFGHVYECRRACCRDPIPYNKDVPLFLHEPSRSDRYLQVRWGESRQQWLERIDREWKRREIRRPFGEQHARNIVGAEKVSGRGSSRVPSFDGIAVQASPAFPAPPPLTTRGS